MKVYVDTDEMYPVYYAHATQHWAMEQEIDVPEEKFNAWMDAYGVFMQAQDEIRDCLRRDR